jgi:hypothetical protein
MLTAGFGAVARPDESALPQKSDFSSFLHLALQQATKIFHQQFLYDW